MNLVEKVQEKLDSLTSYLNAHSRKLEWTTEIHERIAGLAQEFADSKGIDCGSVKHSSRGGQRIAVCVTGGSGRNPHAVEPQFLYDQCWVTCFDNSLGDDGYATELDFAMETEWCTDGGSNDELHRDFLKLVAGSALVKVMVFWHPSKTKSESIIDEFLKQISHFKPRNGDYLLSLFSERQFHHYTA